MSVHKIINTPEAPFPLAVGLKSRKPDAFWLARHKFFSAKHVRKRMQVSEFSCRRCPQCIRWHPLPCCLLWFQQSHQLCHLGHSSPGRGRPSVASVYMLGLSTVLPVPLTLFQSQSQLYTLSSHLCPRQSLPTHPLPSISRVPCLKRRHYIIHDFLILKTSLWAEAALNGGQRDRILTFTCVHIQKVESIMQLKGRPMCCAKQKGLALSL